MRGVTDHLNARSHICWAAEKLCVHSYIKGKGRRPVERRRPPKCRLVQRDAIQKGALPPCPPETGGRVRKGRAMNPF